MKVTRDAFLYMEPEGDEPEFGQCSTCRFQADGQCLVLDVEVAPGDSCGLYLQGDSEDEEPVASVTPEVAGFVSRQVRCENCLYFDAAEGECELFEMLNRQWPDQFDLDERVKAQGCCNAQVPRGSRGPGGFDQLEQRENEG